MQFIGITHLGPTLGRYLRDHSRVQDSRAVGPIGRQCSAKLHGALAQAGWLGIAMPTEYGGAGLGITEATIMMQAIAESGAAMSGASAVHMNIFGLQPVVVFGSAEQKRRMLPPLIAGRDKACFAVTEPDAGLDTTAIKVRAERRGDDYVLSGQKIWISTAQVANKILILARTTPLERVKRKTEGLSLFYSDLDRGRVAVRVIDKMGRHAVDSNEMFFDGMVVPAADASVPRAVAFARSCTA